MKFFKYTFLFIFVSQTYAQKSDFDTIDFKKADSIALVYKYEKLTNIPELSFKLTSGFETDVEKFRAVYKWVCENIENDYVQYSKNKRKRYRLQDDSLRFSDWKTQFRKGAFKTLLEKNKATCTGYAYLVKELAKYANLNCEIVNGYARTSNTDIEKLNAPNHSWIAIKLENKWYLCDPTWASGIQNPESLKFEFQYNDGFFLSTPEIFAINHYPVDKKWLLLAEEHTSSFNEFLDAPILYGKAYTNLSRHYAPKKMHNTIKKNETFVFEFQFQKGINISDVNLLIDNGSSTKLVHPKITSTENKSIIVEYAFERTGFYDVHFFMGSDIISTYTFRVKKEVVKSE